MSVASHRCVMERARAARILAAVDSGTQTRLRRGDRETHAFTIVSRAASLTWCSQSRKVVCQLMLALYCAPHQSARLDRRRHVRHHTVPSEGAAPRALLTPPRQRLASRCEPLVQDGASKMACDVCGARACRSEETFAARPRERTSRSFRSSTNCPVRRSGRRSRHGQRDGVRDRASERRETVCELYSRERRLCVTRSNRRDRVCKTRYLASPRYACGVLGAVVALAASTAAVISQRVCELPLN